MNLYDILGVARDASPADIRLAYKLKAQKLHPDRDGGDEAAFKELQAAYKILKDEDSRAHYDRTGEEKAPGGPSAGDRAVQEIMSIFTQWLQAAMNGQVPWNSDVISDIERNLLTMANQERQRLQSLKQQLSKLEKIIGHIDVDNDEPNFFEGQLLSVKHQIDKNFNDLSDRINTLELAVDKLKHFTYSPEGGLYQQRAPTYASTGTTSWG